MVGNVPFLCDIAHPAPSHYKWKKRSDNCAQINQKCLDHKTFRLLAIVQHIGHKGSERLHRDIERKIHKEENQGSHHKRSESQDLRTVRHQHQCESRNDCANEDERDASSESCPGLVRKHSDDWLHDESGDRSCKPEIAERAEVRAKRLEYCGCVGILKRVSNLDAHKAEAEVPDLPKRKFWFWCFHSDVVIFLTIRKRLYNF